MHRYVKLALLFPIIILLADCAPLQDKNMLSAIAKVKAHPPEQFLFDLPSGEKRMAYQFVTDDGNGKDGAIIFANGSGCISQVYSRAWFAKLKGSFRVLSIDKAGVEPGDFDIAKCSDAFLAKHRLSSYIEDNVAFANAMAQRYRPKQLILYGISEGGLVMAVAAPSVPSAKHLVLFSTYTGLGFDKALAESDGNVGAGKRKETQDYYNKVLLRTDSAAHLYDYYSVGWVQEVLKFSSIGYLQKTHLKILLAHGGQDKTVIISLARQDCEKLQPSPNKLSYFYEPEGDHGMNTPDKQSYSRFYSAFRAWLDNKKDDNLLTSCPFYTPAIK